MFVYSIALHFSTILLKNFVFWGILSVLSRKFFAFFFCFYWEISHSKEKSSTSQPAILNLLWNFCFFWVSGLIKKLVKDVEAKLKIALKFWAFNSLDYSLRCNKKWNVLFLCSTCRLQEKVMIEKIENFFFLENDYVGKFVFNRANEIFWFFVFLLSQTWAFHRQAL